MTTSFVSKTSTLHRIPVYDVRLVQSRRPLRLAETTLAHPEASARALHSLIGLTDREHLAVMFLNGQHGILGAHVAAVGGQQGIGHVDGRVILRAALLACASAMVLGHNHPSGNPSPSDEDLEATRHIMRMARTIEIPVLDHVIVTRDPGRYHSMAGIGALKRLE
jgi:DNA repair protein RadC